MYYPVFGMVHIKEPLLLIGKSNPCGGSGFPLSRYLNGPLPYIRRHITVNKNVLSVSLNKMFPSFLYLYGFLGFVQVSLCEQVHEVLQDDLLAIDVRQCLQLAADIVYIDRKINWNLKVKMNDF